MKRSKAMLVPVALVLALFVVLCFAGCGGGPGDGVTWRTMQVDGLTLRYQATGFASTVLGGARVLASGDVDDPTVLAGVEQITGRTAAEAAELLSSYDTSASRYVSVLELRDPAYVARYWSDADYKLGRWYCPSEEDHLYTPAEACTCFALPLSNRAYRVTLYQLLAGAKVILGTCADMTWNSEAFGPYATGGGLQLYAPEATRWVTDHAELNPDTISLVSELRYPVTD